MEIWKEVKGSYGPYEVSSEGRMRRKGRILKTRANPKFGYVQIRMYKSESVKDTSYPLVHRLAVEAFIGPIPEGHQVNHKNGNRSDNRLENLEIVTASANNLHMWRELNRSKDVGSQHPRSVLTEADVLRIREQHLFGAKQTDIAQIFGIDKTTVRDIVHRRHWTHI